MADRPILFSAPMITALLAGRKTQTRRLCRQANDAALTFVVKIDDALAAPGWFGDEEGDVSFFAGYAPGDRLWVREAWRTHKAYDDLKPGDMGGEESVWPELDRDNCDAHGRYRHGRFMPRWASRLTLIVTDVRVERLQDCSQDDAIAEGIERGGFGSILGWLAYGEANPHHQRHFSDPRESYRTLWDSINGDDAWAANPWVTAISFDVRKGNIDNLETSSG
jgi:hypothetical protein